MENPAGSLLSPFGREILEETMPENDREKGRGQTLRDQLRRRMAIEVVQGAAAVVGFGTVFSAGGIANFGWRMLRGGVNIASGYSAGSDAAERNTYFRMASDARAEADELLGMTDDELNDPDNQERLRRSIATQDLLRHKGYIVPTGATPGPDSENFAPRPKQSTGIFNRVLGSTLDRIGQRISGGLASEPIPENSNWRVRARRMLGDFLQSERAAEAVAKTTMYGLGGFLAGIAPVSLAVMAGFSTLDRGYNFIRLNAERRELARRNEEDALHGTQLGSLLDRLERTNLDAVSDQGQRDAIKSCLNEHERAVMDEVRQASIRGGKVSGGVVAAASFAGMVYGAYGAYQASGSPDSQLGAHPGATPEPTPGHGTVPELRDDVNAEGLEPSAGGVREALPGTIQPEGQGGQGGGAGGEVAGPSSGATSTPENTENPTIDLTRPAGAPQGPTDPLKLRGLGEPLVDKPAREDLVPGGYRQPGAADAHNPNTSMTGESNHYLGENPEQVLEASRGATSIDTDKLPADWKVDSRGIDVDLHGNGNQEHFQVIEDGGKKFALVDLVDRNHNGSLSGESRLSDHWVKVELKSDGTLDSHGVVVNHEGQPSDIDGQTEFRLERKIDVIEEYCRANEIPFDRQAFLERNNTSDYTDLAPRSGVMVDLGQTSSGEIGDGVPDVQAIMDSKGNLEAHWHGSVYAEYAKPDGASAVDNSYHGALKYGSLTPKFEGFMARGGEYAKAASTILDHRSELPTNTRLSLDNFLNDKDYGTQNESLIEQHLTSVMGKNQGEIGNADLQNISQTIGHVVTIDGQAHNVIEGGKVTVGVQEYVVPKFGDGRPLAAEDITGATPGPTAIEVPMSNVAEPNEVFALQGNQGQEMVQALPDSDFKTGLLNTISEYSKLHQGFMRFGVEHDPATDLYKIVISNPGDIIYDQKEILVPADSADEIKTFVEGIPQPAATK